MTENDQERIIRLEANRAALQRLASQFQEEAGLNRPIADSMGDFLADQLSRYKHPESFEIVNSGLRDDAGKVRRTLLRDERAAWLKENRAFRIMPSQTSSRPPRDFKGPHPERG